MGSKYKIGELCKFFRGASVPRARMHESGDYLYVHYGDLYRGFNIYIDVDDPQKPLPAIASSESIKDEQFLADQDIVYVLTSETVDDLGHAFLFKDPRNVPTVAGTETSIMRVIRRDLVLPAYLNYMTQAARFKRLLCQYVKGMKVFRVHPSDVARIEVDLPSLENQYKVVHILDNIESKITLNQRTNDYLAELCEAIATRRNAAEGTLADICSQVADKVSCEEADIRTYVSTESLLADKGGRQIASSLPATGKVTTYEAGDTLVSNIRPYFKKIWYADCNGTCSGDVIVFRANDTSLAPYIYACLRQDAFFEFVMTGSKGTKMPRGDKKQMMTFPINPNFDDDDLATITSAIQQIGTNNRENLNLAGLRDTLLPRLMSGEIDVSEVELPTQPNNHLCAG